MTAKNVFVSYLFLVYSIPGLSTATGNEDVVFESPQNQIHNLRTQTWRNTSTTTVLQVRFYGLLPGSPADQKENERRGDEVSFKDILLRAKLGDETAKVMILEQYKPMLIKGSIINGQFDEDLYQEQCMVLMKCIELFQL